MSDQTPTEETVLRDRETGQVIAPEEPVIASEEAAPLASPEEEDAPIQNGETSSTASDEPMEGQSTPEPAPAGEVPTSTGTDWASLHGALDIVDTAINTLRTKVAELRAYVTQESSK